MHTAYIILKIFGREKQLAISGETVNVVKKFVYLGQVVIKGPNHERNKYAEKEWTEHIWQAFLNYKWHS